MGTFNRITNRWQAWLTAVLFHGPRFVLPAIVIGYVVFWAASLAAARREQTIHFDTAEAYAWGQQLLWGYGKHPPVSGWIAWAWYAVFPATDWSAYALAMVTTGVTVALVWLLAVRVVDRRRALLAAALLFIYPVINFKGFKYNADLALMPFMVLVVLVFTVAFERRTVLWGILLGLAGAAAVLTKYWGVWAIAAVGIAAIANPERKAFFRSPVVYVAAVTFVVALIPHVLWLVHDDFAAFRYASRYVHMPRLAALRSAVTGSGHVVAMLAPVVAVFAFAVRRALWRPDNEAPAADAARRNLFVIVAVLAIAPPITTAALSIKFRSDWMVPMGTLVPLALVAVPRLTISLRAVARAASAVLVYCIAAGIVMQLTEPLKFRFDRHATRHPAFDTLARELTTLWHQRYGTRLPVVVGYEHYAAVVTYYSPDHPKLFTQADAGLAPWIDQRSLQHSGFLGLCPAAITTPCIAQISALSPSVQRIEMTTAREAYGYPGPDDHWTIVLSAPRSAPDDPS